MKTLLRLLLSAISVFLLHLSYAQVTLVSNNTYLSGFVLPNGNPILFSDSTDYLYTTNGTATSVLTTNATYDTGSYIIYKNQLYFTGTDVFNDAELWATDGTSGGTRLIKNISVSGSSAPDDFFVFNNILYFTADDGVNGRRLWSSDGTAGNATLVSNAVTVDSLDQTTFFPNGSNVFFISIDNNNNTGLYKLNTSSVSLVKEFSGGTVNLITAELANKSFFTIDTTIDSTVNMIDTSYSYEQLWVTDGTTNGTQMIHSFASSYGYNSIDNNFIQFKDLLYFSYYDPTGSSSLWTTDGTSANTVLFKSFGIDTSHYDYNYNYYSLIGLSNSVVFNNRLYFIGYTNSAGSELWSTDGTLANTSILKDIYPGSKSSLPLFLINAGSFINDFVKSGLSDFNFQQFENLIVPFKGKLYFSADDGIHGRELWSTDGTAANTNLVKDINTDTTASGLGFSSAFGSYYTTNGIYFTADDGTTGIEPWITDGTANGTHLVADINPGRDSSNPQYYFIYNNQLYFTANNGDNNYSVNDSLGLPDLYKIDQSNSALPVTLLNFTASKQTESVLLDWTTTNEINTHHFVVERSTDGVHFIAIGTSAALGSSTSKRSYQLNDASALQAGSSILYYRLQTVNKDGTHSYSNVLTVRLQNGVFTFTLSPNPVRNQLTVSFTTNNTTNAMLRIVDVNGKPFYQQAYSSLSQSSIQQNINVEKLTRGVYFIQLITDKETKTLKFVK